MEYLFELDQMIFEWINLNWSNKVLDTIFIPVRNKYTWIPLYLAVVLFMIFKHKKNGIKWLAILILTVILSDQISAGLIKPLVERIRPCNNLQISNSINVLVPCGRGYSFPSAHACNHFALAFFALISLKQKYKYLNRWLIPWATIIAIAQVYVGVHYPIDIFIGALLGIFIGYFTSLIHKKYFSL